MGGKRKFNAKGRQVVDTLIDNSVTKQIKLDIPGVNSIEYGGYDPANALVLPSEKRTTKVQKTAQKITRILSKKQRKNLEKIVDKKRKKEGRAELLDKLASVQLPVDELKRYTSIINVQTRGLKHHLKEDSARIRSVDAVRDDEGSSGDDEDQNKQRKWSSIAGQQKKNRLALLNGYAQDDDSDTAELPARDYNVIGVEAEESSSSEDEEEKVEEERVEDAIKNEEEIQIEPECEEVVEKIEEIQKCGPVKVEYRPTVYVHVERTKDIQAARLKLPILSEEQVIMETINENQIIILAGETGSGKTTQVPQFLYEAGYAKSKLIGITEPRRVAAISMSKRVAHEMNLSTDIVSYLIRFEGNVTDQTKIKFMTDGVLLKEIENDFVLSRYSVIILDEAHERSVFTDILIGLLSRIVILRRKRADPLKLIVMSATLRVEDFTANSRLFRQTPPVIKVEARQFPVTVHFNKRTTDEYVKEAFQKAVKIHNKLPEGGILIFLTGQQEVNYVLRKLRKAFPYRPKNNDSAQSEDVAENPQSDDSSDEFDIKKAIRNTKKAKKKMLSQMSLPVINLDSYKLPTDDTEADLLDDESLQGDSDLDSDDDMQFNTPTISNSQPMWVLPLYSLLPSDKQSKVFDVPPAGTRLCVVSTNVAETSLTIPNIKYVIDCGRQKTRLYDKITGVSSFVVTYTSKAAANQRAGRAGRTAPGHCYRLYSSAVYNDEFADFAVPDIQRKPVDDLMLQMKCMGIDKVINFPFPSPPDIVQLTVAEEKLKQLGAIEDVHRLTKTNEKLTKVTPLGLAISAFPVAPRFGKMLALSHQHNLLPYTVCMVAALSVQEVLVEVTQDAIAQATNNTKWHLKRKSWAGTGNSLLLGDPVVLIRAVGAAEYAGSLGKLAEFCQDNGLRPKAIAEIRKLRVQLTNEINLSLPDVNLCVDPKMKPLTDVQAKLLRQILLAGMGDQVARKIPDDELKSNEDRRKLKHAYRCPDMEEPVFMHSSSVLRKSKPEWVVYQEIYELQNGDSRKMFMRGVTAIEPDWLLIYARSICNIRSINEEAPKPPYYNPNTGRIYCMVDATFGRSGWPIPYGEIEIPVGEVACRYFAMFFLQGDIFGSIKKYAKSLRSQPKNIIKSWSRNQEHVSAFVSKLLKREITTRQRLLDVWKTDGNYLLPEFCDFLVQINAAEVSMNWPPTDN